MAAGHLQMKQVFYNDTQKTNIKDNPPVRIMSGCYSLNTVIEF